MWVSLIRNKQHFEQKADMNMIQNDNKNVDGVDQHHKAWQSLLPLHWWYYCIFITLHSFDAVLCLMMCLITCEASVVSVSSSLVFFST